MRGDTDPAAAGEPTLSPAERNAAAAAAVLLVAVLVTGGASSVVLPLFIAALIALLRYVDRPMVLLAPPAAALVLLLAGALRASGEGGGLWAALAVVAASVPGLLWRREVRRGAIRTHAAQENVPRHDEPSHAQAVPAADDERADLNRALAAVATRVGARTAVLWDVDGYRGTARPRASSGVLPQGTVRLSGDPLGWCWEQGMRLRLEQTPRWAEPGVAVIAERLRRHDDDGDMVTLSFDAGQGLPDELAFEEAAVYLRGVLALQEAGAGAASLRRRLGSLLAGLGQIPGELELDSLAHDLCLTAMNITEGTGAAIGFSDGVEGVILACAGNDGGPRPGDRFVAPSSELALAVRAGSRIVREAPDWTLGRTSVAHEEERWRTRPRALAALPLRGASGDVGVLGVWTSRGRTLDPEGLDLLAALAPYAALHLEHARTYGRMRETAEQDPLTQLSNRRAFDQIFAAEANRFSRYGRPLSLLMLDIDHFKSINDQYGHEAGDEVLRRFAARVTSCIRDVDTAARLGGEEFVLLLPETSLAAAMEVAERVRVAVAAQPVPWRAGAIPVRVSIGVSACPERVPRPAELVASADAALYRAKDGGRNRVVAADGAG
jgi:diguanylate cyclase (GGDEF)-like protein